jgi:hypothetical protein
MSAALKYQGALSQIPPTGCGCHPFLLSVANLGALAGFDPDQIFSDIRGHIPHGKRPVSDREIQDAIRKAVNGKTTTFFKPRPEPPPAKIDGKAALEKILTGAAINDDADLWESSPIRLLDRPERDPALLLQSLYRPDDLIFIGDRINQGLLGSTIRTAREWVKHFQAGGSTSPHIILNPLDGEARPTKGGDKMSLRGDANVKEFRFCLIEFDGLDRESQIRFFTSVKLPIVCLIDSGGKSIHAWIDVQKMFPVTTAEQWQTEVKGRLYDQILKPLGVDGACCNPARLSRLPGHIRDENFQKILWLGKNHVCL